MYIEEKINEIDNKLDRILLLMGDMNKSMTIQSIADMLGVPRQSLYTNKRYLLPDFGKDLKKGKKYTKSEVIAWNSKGDQNLYREWKGLEKKN